MGILKRKSELGEGNRSSALESGTGGIFGTSRWESPNTGSDSSLRAKTARAENPGETGSMGLMSGESCKEEEVVNRPEAARR